MRKIPKSISAHNLNEWLNSEIEQPIIIDVREVSELEIVTLPFSFIHMPMSEITVDYLKSRLNILENKKIVVLCHMGVRSFHFSQWMLDNDFAHEIWNLEEGIDGWSQNIDPQMARY